MNQLTFSLATMKSLLLAMVVAALYSTVTWANCPDPSEVHPQQGANIEQRRWVTNSGWVSDEWPAFVADGSPVILIQATIVSPDTPVHGLECRYAAGDVSFTMRPPGKYQRTPIQIVNKDNWIPNVFGGPDQYGCAFGGNAKNQCEFTFKSENTEKKSLEKVRQDPFE